MAVGNHSWGTTTTKKLIKLFPALEAIELVSACSLAVRFTWALRSGPLPRAFLCPHRPSAAPVSPRRAQGSTKKVAHAHGLSDFSLAAIPSLRKFKWGWAFNSDDEIVMNLVRGRELLEELDLSSAEGMGEYSSRSGLTDALLIELGKSCPRLHKLRLRTVTQRSFSTRAPDCV